MTAVVDHYQILQRMLDEQGYFIARGPKQMRVPNTGDVLRRTDPDRVVMCGNDEINSDVVCVGMATAAEWVRQCQVYFPYEPIPNGPNDIYLKLVAE